MSEEEQKYFKGLIGFTFDSDDIRYIEKIVDKKDKEIERLNKEIESWIKLINYNEIEDIPQYIEDLEVDNKSLKKENKEINKENKRLNNIIKEAIELINEYKKIIEDGSNKGADYVYINSPYIKLQEIEQILGSDKVE